MSQALAIQETEITTSFEALIDKAKYFASNGHAANTKKAYAKAWNSFLEWCVNNKSNPIEANPPEALVGLYIADIADRLKPASLEVAIASIRHYLRQRGISFDTKHPSIAQVLKGIRREKGCKQVQKEPVLVEDLRAMVAALSDNLMGTRDRAILLIGFAGAFRRSEIVDLEIKDLRGTRDGFVITMRKSKTDQDGTGQEKAIPYGANASTCPVRALKDWLQISKIKEGKLFRSIDRHGKLGESLSDKAVALIIKRNPHLTEKSKNYSGHSLRAGLCTSAASARVPEDIIMAQTGHKNRNSLQKYVRRGLQFKDNAACMIGL